jgi:hypothetical protein
MKMSAFAIHHLNLMSRAGDMAQVLKHLLCKHEALSSNLDPTKKKKKNHPMPNLTLHLLFSQGFSPGSLVLEILN